MAEHTSNQQNTQHNNNETIPELAHRHLLDEAHTTTDEELRNAKLKLTENVEAPEGNLHAVDDETVFPPLPIEKDEKGESDKPGNSPLPNPYDVLK